MILKALDPLAASDALARAGRHAEATLAHYLHRGFKDDPQLTIFHGLRLEVENDAAQVDHLVLHRHGMIIIESKSVTSRIQVNEHEEWRRWFNGTWRGMPSPIRQAQRQGEFLRAYLQAHREGLRGKYCFGLRQGGFRHMPIDLLVAISDTGIIERPRQLPLPELCKADQATDRVQALVERYHQANHWANLDVNTGGYTFSPDEFTRITAFLLEHHRPLPPREAHPPVTPGRDDPGSSPPAPLNDPALEAAATCRHCDRGPLAIQYGRYGYYFQCLGCQQTMPIQRRCSRCGRKERVRKSGLHFSGECAPCGTSHRFHTNPADDPGRKDDRG
jgi:hypothetical protein